MIITIHLIDIIITTIIFIQTFILLLLWVIIIFKELQVNVFLIQLLSPVLRYHEWMKSPELQQLTASEPLSLEQEHDMQRSWREDGDSEEASLISFKDNLSSWLKVPEGKSAFI